MALTEAQQLTVAKILRQTPSIIEYQITLLGTDATAAWQTAVEAEITRWTTAGVNFVSVEPKEANFGARINPNNDKNDIRSNLAILFDRPDWASGGGQVNLARG